MVNKYLLDYVFSSQRIRYVGPMLQQVKEETANMEGKNVIDVPFSP